MFKVYYAFYVATELGHDSNLNSWHRRKRTGRGGSNPHLHRPFQFCASTSNWDPSWGRCGVDTGEGSSRRLGTDCCRTNKYQQRREICFTNRVFNHVSNLTNSMLQTGSSFRHRLIAGAGQASPNGLLTPRQSSRYRQIRTKASRTEIRLWTNYHPQVWLQFLAVRPVTVLADCQILLKTGSRPRAESQNARAGTCQVAKYRRMLATVTACGQDCTIRARAQHQPARA